MSDPSATTRYSPLHERHVALGAAFTDFGGWQMPVRYTSDLAEHHAVRTAAGLFDISHMGEIFVTGEGAGDFLDAALAGRISAVPMGRAKYTLLLAEDGGIIDDLIVYHDALERFLVVANAGNREVVAAELTARAATWNGAPIELRDDSDGIAMLAVQGPNALAIMQAIDGLELDEVLETLPYYASSAGCFTIPHGLEGRSILVARTGYTGEDGFEILVPVDIALEVWDAIIAAGEPHGLVPAGLAARDTLRLEAGMPLYGHELSRDIQPVQAGLGKVVVTAKDTFVGKDAILAGPGADARVLVGLAGEGRRAGREGYAVLADGTPVGVVTSGALSPTLGHPIAMAYIDPDAAGAALTIDVRGTQLPVTVTALPFYRRKK